MITRKFIEKVHAAFDELSYRESEQLNYDDFMQSAVRTLTHCKDLADAIETVKLFQFCLNKWKKIEKMFRLKSGIFNEYEYGGNLLISLVSDEEALGTYYITNGIQKKIKKVFAASQSFDEEMFALGYKSGRFTIYDDGQYYLKYSKMSASKIKLFDSQNHFLCNIVLGKDLNLSLEKNSTPYELIAYDNCIGIYERDYIDSLTDDDDIDTDKMLADIEWDILNKNSNYGVAKLNVYSSDMDLEVNSTINAPVTSKVYESHKDLEMPLLFATSTFLVFQKYMEHQKAMMYFLASKH